MSGADLAAKFLRLGVHGGIQFVAGLADDYQFSVASSRRLPWEVSFGFLMVDES